ncbi:M23 family metallopeptidase [Nocardioides sp. SYSU DS0663]|uniref:M23 family metallopeptidase n=1 Tax=Nocardioides sp. SYSU DS0663 TaxID=3416445 RepID=UPI003F4BA04F
MRALGRSLLVGGLTCGLTATTLSGTALSSASAATADEPPTAPATAYEMPFPCGQTWTGSTRAHHSPSVKSIDWNRPDDVDDPVVASAAGRVTTAVQGSRGYGTYVVVEHASGGSTVYAHLNRLAVTAGQAVDQGTLLGLLGSTGNSSGPHLHYEQRVGSAVQDAWFHGAAFAPGSQTSQNCVDVPAAGNFVGGPAAELAVFRRADRASFRIMRGKKKPRVMRIGTATDQPVVGDWDGDGRTDPGVRSPATGTFQLKSRAGTLEVVLGATEDTAVAGDWDGDGAWEIGVHRPATADFLLRAADGALATVALGDADDLPVTGDWDGNGVTDVGVYDLTTATYTLRRVDADGTVWTASVAWGRPGDLPVTGDWDANGRTDLGSWTPATATFSQRRATSPTVARAAARDLRFGRPRG